MAKNDISSVYVEVVVNADGTVKPMSAAQKAFFNFRKETGRHRGLGKSIATEMTKMAGGLFAAHRAVSLLSSAARQMFTDVSAFQRMSVELKVATGSAVRAEEAFAMIQDTAKKLPSSIQDITEGFVRLKNMGLDASQNSLISFSNTAAAMGKSLKQFVEGVADANTLEFERLKEFGILARNQGNKIRFTFRGTTKEVENSSKAIIGYLTDIGNTEFAGAATEQIDTLSSRVTKLKDAIFNLNIAAGEGEAGAVGDFFKFLEEKADSAADAISMDKFRTKLTEAIPVSGQGAAFLGMGGPAPMVRVEKSLSGIRQVFKNLSTKELPLANRLIEEQKDKVDKARGLGEELLKQERHKLRFMVRGLTVSRERIKAQREELEAEEKRIAKVQKEEQIAIQSDSIAEAREARRREFALEAAKETNDVNALIELQALAVADLAKAEEKLQRAREQVTTPATLKTLVDGLEDAEDKLFAVQQGFIKIGDEAAEAAKQAAEELERETEKKAKELKKQKDKTEELGGAQNFIAEAERKRALESLVRTSKGNQLLDVLRAKHEDVRLEILRVKEASKGLIGDDLVEAQGKLDDLQQDMDETANAIIRQKDKMDEFADSMKDLFEDVREGIADAVIEGENFKGVLESILKQIAKSQIMKAIGSFGDQDTKATGLLSLFTRAKGGPVTAGRPYLVGERGPELFTPTGSGSIVPNHRMGTGTRTVNVVNNFSIDGGDRREMQQMIASSVSASVNLAVNKMQDNKRRGIR